MERIHLSKKINLIKLALIVFSVSQFSLSEAKAQSLTSVSPNTGNIGDVLNVFISGQSTNFQIGTSSIQTTFDQGATSISASYVSSTATQLEVLLDLNNISYPSGSYDLSVNTTNHGLLTLANAFTIGSKAVENASPREGFIGQIVDVFITGRNIDFTTVTIPPEYVGVNGGDTINTSILGTRTSDTLEIRLTLTSASLKAGNYHLNLFTPSDTLTLRNALELKAANISGVVFLDNDTNGVQGPGENGLNNVKLELLPANKFAYTNDKGEYSFLDLGGGTFQVVIHLPDSTYSVTNPPDTQTVVISAPNEFNASYGILATIINADLSLTSGVARCSRFIDYYVSINNRGNVAIDGVYFMIKDSAITYTPLTSSAADSVRGDTIFYSFDNLLFGGRHSERIRCNLPSVTILPIGTKLQSFSELYLVDNVGAVISGTEKDDFDDETVRCSWDPNDKLVTPLGLDSLGLVLHNTKLKYTVRFQNTGNDTAFKVVVRDTLSSFLDISTFEFLDATHNVLVELSDAGELAFTFENILLVDSTTNEPESNGSLTFSISPKDGLTDSTAVLNKAAIYFDFNPPIITNEVLNTYVSTLIVSLDEQQLAGEEVQIYPNPNNGRFKVQTDEPFNNAQITIYDLKGQVVYEEAQIYGTTVDFNLSNYPSGVYMLTITDGERFMNGKLILY